MAVLELVKVGFTYADRTRPALSSISLRLHQGEVLGLLGPCEAGKSSLCFLLSGFIPRFYKGRITGRYRLFGRDACEFSMADMAARVGLVVQNPHNQLSGSKFTVAEEIAFGLENLGMPRREIRRRIDEVLAELDLADLAGRNPFDLSGGQIQRVALAGIVALRPDVLVLDEPASQLDPGSRQEIMSVVKRYAQRGGAAIVTEQNVESLLTVADRLVLLAKGSLVREGSVIEVAGSSELADAGVQEMRYTITGRIARMQGLWPAGIPLPITLEAAADGFNREGR